MPLSLEKDYNIHHGDKTRLTMFAEGSSKRFNTKDILFYFVNLLSPEKFKNLDPHTKALIAEVSNGLAQIDKEIQNPFPKSIDTLKVFLGTPAKGSKPLDILTHLNTFENNFMPALTLQQEELKKSREVLRTQFTLLTAQGEKLDPARVEHLKAEIEKLRSGRVKVFLDQKGDLLEKLKPLQDEAAKATGKTLQTSELEEGPAVVATPPTPQNK